MKQSSKLNLDDPRVTSVRREKLRKKSFLEALYLEWYHFIEARLPPGGAHWKVLELGSGPGFLQDVLPQVITSEVLEVSFVDRIEDATALTFSTGELDAVVMTDVLHHIPDVETFFREAQRVLRPGGRIICIEPWRTAWSRVIYRFLHHEPFIEDVGAWKLPAGGPLSGANGALPWIVFERDSEVFTAKFPSLSVLSIDVFMPLSYLLSGGFSYPQLVPRRLYGKVRRAEHLLQEWRWGLFAGIVVERQ